VASLLARAAVSGVVYAAVVFAAGFVLGVLRVLVLVPLVGEAAGVLVESPVILVVAWFAGRWIARRGAVPPRTGPRIVMGAAALSALLVADLALGILLLGLPPAMLAARYATAAGLIGLAGQVLFAAFPLVAARTERSGREP